MQSLLARCINEDFGLEGNGRWYHAKEHDSLVFDSEKDLFYWNSEAINGDIFTYLLKVRKLPYQDAKNYIKVCGENATFIHEVRNKEETVVYPKLVDVFYNNLVLGNKDYFYNRTITDETIRRFKLGLNQDWYTIPINQNGVFKQFQMRRDKPKKAIRGYYDNVGPLLFNSDILTLVDKIFIVESPISAIILMQNGIPSVSYISGSDGFMPEWYSYFMDQKEIFIVYDFDSAGKFGSKRTAKILGEERCKIYTMENSEVEHYGPDDWFIDGKDKDSFLELIYTKSKKAYEIPEKRGKVGNSRVRH
jgi:hypothetical protein